MPNQPRQPMDAQLRAYAAQRRREGEPPFVLPPDTRRILLQEVERYRPGSPRLGRSGLWAWLHRWPRWSWMGIAAAMAALGSLIWIGFGHRRSLETPLARVNSENRRSVERPTSAGATVPPPGSSSAGVKSVAGPLLAAKAPVVGPLPPAAPAPARADDGTRLALVSTDAAVQPVKPQINPAAVPPANRPAPTVSAERAFVGRFATASGGASQLFEQVAAPHSRGPGGAGTAAGSVLNRFRMEAVGDRLRIVDADGSVYESQPLASQLARAAAAVPVADRPPPTAATADPGSRSPMAMARRPGAAGRSAVESTGVVAAARDLSFEAIGTNRTAQRSVRFQGALVLTDPSSLATPPARPASGGAAQPLDYWIQNATVRGQVRVGEQGALPIHAVPAGPGR